MEDISAQSIQIVQRRSGSAAPARARHLERMTARWASLPASAWLGLTFLTTYVIFFELYTQTTSRLAVKAPSVATDLATVLSYLAPVLLIEVATGGRIRKALFAFYFGLHLLVDGAFLGTYGHLDYAFVRDNLAEAVSGVGAGMILKAFPIPVYCMLAVESVLLVLFLRLRRPAREAARPRARLVVALSAAAVLVAAATGQLRTRDALLAFGHSVVPYYAKNLRMAEARSATPGSYPLVHSASLSVLPDDVVGAIPADRPNVILVLLESFSAVYVGKIAPDGAPYTPTMDGLIATNLSAGRFYGNSIQTCHGHFATLCSLVPSYRKKEAYISPLSLECLPDVLRHEGYSTALYSGEHAENFDGIDEFGARLGFEETKNAAPSSLDDEERAHVWGWGLQDDLFYAWAMRNVTARRDAKKPFFVTLAPVSNHYPFDEEPGREPIAGEPTDARGVYTSSLRAADRRLARLFELLDETGLAKNTLVVVTGDHSFPADEHGSHYNERGFYEESFRTPLVMVWPGHLPGRQLDGAAFSQIDIAPTVLDLLRIQPSTPFQGRSVFASGPRFLPLVQPYDGQYLGAISWPWKYREHALTGEARVVDLEADPSESNPLDPSVAPPAIAQRLHADVERIHLSQSLLLSNEIWPVAP